MDVETKAEFEKLAELIARSFQAVNQRFDRLDERMDRLEARMDGLERLFDNTVPEAVVMGTMRLQA